MAYTEPGPGLQAELGRILGSKADEDLVAAVHAAVTESVCSVLNQLATIRHLLMYFNTAPDWNAVLEVIQDTLHVDAVQVGCMDSLNNLQYHMLPPDQPIDEDFTSLLHSGLMIDDPTPEGMIHRLGTLLSVEDDLLGIMVVIRINGAPFSDFERIVLNYFADEIATTLHHLDLYGLVRQQADRLAGLLKSGRENPGETSPG